jgi:hypothetical protein
MHHFRRNNAAADPIEDAQMRISIEIVRQPADCKCFKILQISFPGKAPPNHSLYFAFS